MKRLKKATKASVWVQDILRHTSITYQAERDKDEALTAFNCGTSAKMMDQHYRNFIDDPELIEKFWNLIPATVLAISPNVSLPKKIGIEWPSKTQLTKMVWEKPLVQAAKELNVSDVALRKRCIRMGIILPKPGDRSRQLPQA